MDDAAGSGDRWPPPRLGDDNMDDATNGAGECVAVSGDDETECADADADDEDKGEKDALRCRGAAVRV